MKLSIVIFALIYIAVDHTSVADTAIDQYYDAFIYPNQIDILDDPDLALAFINPNVYYRNRGGVMIQGYEKFVDNTYGTSPYQSDAIATFTSWNARRMVKNGNTIAITVDFNLTPTTLGQQQGIQATKITENSYFVLDNQGKIIQYDAIAENFDSFWISLGVDFTDPDIRAFIIDGICTNHDDHCHGNNDQFKPNEPSCSTYLNTLPTGTSESGNMNNVICRYAMQPVISRNPNLYCSSVGSASNTFCSDSNTYLSYYTNNSFFPNPFIAV
jgi:hypothetical protein